MLEARGVVKRYGDTVAVDGVDVVVGSGTVVGLVGPNGSGKTTMLHAAAGLVRIDAGALLVSGHQAGSIPARRQTAVVPDDQPGFDELTVLEYVRVLVALYGLGADAHERARRLIEAFGLESRLTQRLSALSKGLRRQATLVAALALGTPLVLIDEATVALDPEAVVVLRETIATIARSGTAVLVATQDLHFAERTCDEVVLLRAGQIVTTGPVDDILRAYGADTLESAFLEALGEATMIARVRERLSAL